MYYSKIHTHYEKTTHLSIHNVFSLLCMEIYHINVQKAASSNLGQKIHTPIIKMQYRCHMNVYVHMRYINMISILYLHYMHIISIHLWIRKCLLWYMFSIFVYGFGLLRIYVLYVLYVTGSLLQKRPIKETIFCKRDL